MKEMKESDLLINHNGGGKNRYHYIDVMRGICMICVVLGHSLGSNPDDILSRAILSFHMPAFFFISGFCFNLSDKSYKVIDKLKHKIRGLIKPYFFFSVLGLLMYWSAYRFMFPSNLTFEQTIIGLLWADGKYGVNVVKGDWFVYDLVWISLLYTIIRRFGMKISIIGLIFMFVVHYSMNECNSNSYITMWLARVSGGFLFYAIGDILRVSFLRLNLFINGNKKLSGTIVGLFLLLVVVLSRINHHVYMYEATFGNTLLFLGCALFAIIAIYILSSIIAESKVLEYFGVNSVVVLFIHFYFLDIFRGVYKLSGTEGYFYDYPWCIICFAVIMCAMIPSISLVRQYFNYWIK